MTIASLLSWFKPAEQDPDELLVRGQDVRHLYVPQRLLVAGDMSDIHLATAEDAETLYLLKVSRTGEGRACLETERKALTRLLAAAGNTTYRHYLPELVESFVTADRSAKRVNVFRYTPGNHTLEQVHQQHAALDGRHLAWIFNRLLAVLGFCHRHHIVHGAVLPGHVLVHAASHGVQLIGWGQSVIIDQPIRSVSPRYRDWYPAEVHQRRPVGPATDLFLAARCLVYLAGGDPLTSQLPESVPPPMRRFIATCLFDSARMRPDDAWALLEDFDHLLQGLYGPPTFHPLTLT